jgi:DNA-binding transcriptional MerR regulator
MDKAPDAFRTISEVADELDLPQHVLRFWETRFTQIKPMKRGGGRRYYRPDDVDLLRGIRHLLYGEGYTIRGVQRIFKDQGVKFVQSVWKAGAPQPPRQSEEDEPDAGARPLARPLPGTRSRSANELEGSRRLFGFLPTILGSGEDLDSAQPTRPWAEQITSPIEEIGDHLASGDNGEADVDAIDADSTAETVTIPPTVTASYIRASAPDTNGTSGDPGARGFTRDDLRKLHTTLYELGECRRLIDAAMTGAH